MSYDEIKRSQLYHADVLVAVETRPDLDPEMFQIPNDIGFPTLKEVLQQTNSALAFNLEVKYPQMTTSGDHQCDGYYDRNRVADLILNVLADHAKDRPIVISSFDFDTCLAFALKQSVWPIATLTKGKFALYDEPRTQRIELAAQFARNNKIWVCSTHVKENQN